MVASDDPGKLSNSIKEKLEIIQKKLDSLQGKLVQGTELVGFMRTTFNDTSRLWTSYSTPAVWSPNHIGFLSSTGDTLQSFSDELDAVTGKTDDLIQNVIGLASASAVIASGTNAFLFTVDAVPRPTVSPFFYSPLDKYKKHKDYQRKLGSIDPILGQTYGELIEIVNATCSDPTRPGMFLARQLFDHLFDVLAPDDDVRNSKYWHEKTEKESKDKNAIWRIEKIAYSAFEKVSNPLRAETLYSASIQTLEVYKLLNAAHTRGALKEAESSQAVQSMIRITQEWVDSIV